jgi:predicted MFS family arabinose efflux permease
MNPRRLFVASCISLVATAMAFAIRGDIMGALRLTFELDATQVGAIASAAFLGFALSIFIGGPLCDAFGMGRLLGLACFFHISGVIMTIFAPGFGLLWLATLIVGFGNGLVEAVINPLAATMYPDQKTHKLNVLHSWWPGGQITAGVLAYALTRWLTPDAATATPEQIKFAWQVKMALIVIAAVIYGILILGQKFPPTERVASNVSTADMIKETFRPGFILWFFIMFLTAATELGPMQWVPNILTEIASINGILVLIYINVLMFVMRYFAGPIAHKISPIGLLLCSSILSAIGLYALSSIRTAPTAFLAATVFAIGICYFWPTMLGVTSERYPKGGALLLGLMGTAGNIAVFLVLPIIGRMYDDATIKSAGPAIAERITLAEAPQDVDAMTRFTNSWTDAVSPLIGATSGRLNQEAVNQIVSGGTDEEKAAIDAALKTGAATSFRRMAVVPVVLILIFAIIWIRDYASGGYKAVQLDVGQAPE